MSVIIVLFVIVGWYASIKGLGPVKNIKDALKYGLDINGGVYVVMEADTGKMKGSELQKTMEQTREVINKRVDALGVSNATVSVEGNNRLRIEMPGVDNAEEAIKRVGTTAQLKFTLADGTEYLTGDDVKDASYERDSNNGGYKITLKFTKKGQEKFAKATERAASGDVKPSVKTPEGNSVDAKSVVIWLDDKILTYPTASKKIDSDSCEITSASGYTQEEASQESALIRGGALPVALHEVSSSVQTASVGADALDKSIMAGAIGLGLVFILMLLMYNLLGLFADIALALYVLLVLWIMAGMGAVLTLPGIAGIVLGIGMAVDANVIIFTRIKEEIGRGRSIRVAVHEGFRHALVTVLDSQITTLIATIVLYELGSTTVKGFAVTLMISIIVSIFTAVVVSQIFINTIAESRFARNRFFGCKEDGTPKKLIHREFSFIEHRKVFYCISGVVIVIGLGFLLGRGLNYGIDFTGGTMIQMDMGKKVPIKEINDTLKDYKLNEEIVYAGEKNDQIIIRTTKALDNAKRAEVENALIKKYKLNKKAIVASEEFGASIGQEIRTNAIRSILIAAIGMLLYIIFRFKSWKFGVAAVSGLAHDVLILIGVYAVFRITVNNPFIAAILTIVGYSINDTIVIFDRVRENLKLMRGKPTLEILNHSINQTLDRSVMTSMTTLISIIPLLILVSSQLAQFVFPLMIGVAVGTYSSIFFCSPVFYELNRREEQSRYLAQQKNRKRIEARKAAQKEAKRSAEAKTGDRQNIENGQQASGSKEQSNNKSNNKSKAKKSGKGSKNKKKKKKKR